MPGFLLEAPLRLVDGVRFGQRDVALDPLQRKLGVANEVPQLVLAEVLRTGQPVARSLDVARVVRG
jgi:hypothetical protein